MKKHTFSNSNTAANEWDIKSRIQIGHSYLIRQQRDIFLFSLNYALDIPIHSKRKFRDRERFCKFLFTYLLHTGFGVPCF